MKMQKLVLALFLISAGVISFNLPSANALGGGGNDDGNTSCGSGSLGDFCSAPKSDAKVDPNRRTEGVGRR